MKNGNKDKDVLGDSLKRFNLPCPWAERKIRTALTTNQIARFVTVPSEKKLGESLICELWIKT